MELEPSRPIHVLTENHDIFSEFVHLIPHVLSINQVFELIRQLFDKMHGDFTNYTGSTLCVPPRIEHLHLSQSVIDSGGIVKINEAYKAAGVRAFFLCNQYKLFEPDGTFKFFLENITERHLLLQYDKDYSNVLVSNR